MEDFVVSGQIIAFGSLLAALLILLVIKPFLGWMGSNKRPEAKEWQNLHVRIRDLTRQDLEGLSLTEPTHSALNMVLTDRPGVANKHNLPIALQILDDAGAHAAASIRSLATISVFIGLFGTALVFAQILPDMDNQSNVLEKMSAVYMVNGIAIALALIIYAFSRFIEERVHEVSCIATIILSQLPDRDESDVDPLLLSTLREMTHQMQQQFQEGMGKWQEQQLGDIRAITAEIRGLADGIRQSVQTLSQHAETDTKAILESIRSTQVSVESSAIRLESGLGKLASDGAPAIAALVASADSLGESTRRFEKSGALSAVSAMKECADDLRKSIVALPDALDNALTAGATRMEAAAADHMQTAASVSVAALDASTRRMASALSDGMFRLPEAVSAATLASLEPQVTKTGLALEAMIAASTGLQTNSRSLADCIGNMDTTVNKLEAAIDRAAIKRSSWKRGS
jgi:hypothetical protein